MDQKDQFEGKDQLETIEEEQEKKLRSGLYRKGLFHGVLYSVIILVLAVAIFTVIKVGIASLGNTTTGETATTEAVTEDMSQVLSNGTQSKLAQILSLLEQSYYEDIDTSSLTEGVYKGVVESLGDPYTEYYTADEYEQLEAYTSGTYSGIGAILGTDETTGTAMISSVYDESPAKEAGLKSGDLILKIDGESTSDMELSDVSTNIKGEEGTTVTLTIDRNGEQMDVTVERKDINMPTVEYEMMDSNVGYIRLTQFATNTADDFSAAVTDLSNQGMQYLIIDLRDNGGGLVSSVTDILDTVLPEGETVYMEDKDGNRTDYYSDDENQIDVPIAVLINGNSASASEIFAAAIRDFDYGTLIGTTTYGKGVYQGIQELSDGSAVKVTIGKFYSPKGNNFNEVGIDPDVELEYENLAGDDADYDRSTDNQIQKAVEVLTQGE